MSEICSTCGLPKDLCVCETIAKEGQQIVIRTEKRCYGKATTLIEGINPKSIDLKDIMKKLKAKLACGGTVKKNIIELQGNHVQRIKKELVKLGFSEDSIVEK